MLWEGFKRRQVVLGGGGVGGVVGWGGGGVFLVGVGGQKVREVNGRVNDRIIDKTAVS